MAMLLKLVKSNAFWMCLLSLYYICFSIPALAYLDSGSASMILQMVVAGAVGAMMFLKVNWLRIKTFVGQYFKKH